MPSVSIGVWCQSILSPLFLEIKLCAQLNLSGTDGCRSSNPSECRAGDNRGRKIEGRVIGQIRNVGSQLEPVSFGDMDVLCKCRVEVEVTGSTEEIPAGVAEIPRSRRCEQPSLGRVEVEFLAGHRIVEHLAQVVTVGAVRRCLADVRYRVRTGIDRERPARFRGQQTGNLPPSRKLVKKLPAVAAKSPAFPEGKIVNPIGLQNMGSIEIGRRIIQPAIVNINGRRGPRLSGTGAHARKHGIEGSGIERFGERVAHLPIQTIVIAMMQLHDRCMISGEVVRIDHEDAATELRVRNNREQPGSREGCDRLLPGRSCLQSCGDGIRQCSH